MPGRAPPNSRTVLIAGATGFLGRSAIHALSSAGVHVRGLVRDPAKRSIVIEAGGTPVPGDVLDPASLRSAAEGCDAILHLAANPPEGVDPRRVRVEGARHLVTAAREVGATRLVVGSGYWVYAGQAEPLHEDSPVDPRGESRVNFETERVALSSNDPGRLEVVVARPGMVYGNGSWFRGMAEAIRAGRYHIVGDGANRWSFVSVGDAGTAFRRLVDRGVGGRIYNVCDDRPVELGEFTAQVARELRVDPPSTIPLQEAVAEVGDDIAHHLAADRPMSSQRLRELGWRPGAPEVRAQLPALLREMFPA